MSGESKSLADKDYVVYVVPQDPNCAAFLFKLKTEFENVFNKTLVQDVRVLQVKPPWLKFVPTFVEKKSKKMYSGDEILEFLKTIPPEFTFSFAGSKSKFCAFDTGLQYNSLDSYNITNAYRLSDASSDGPPSTNGGSSKNAEQQQRQLDSQRRLEEYKEAREASTRSRQPTATPRNLMEDGQPLGQSFSQGPPPGYGMPPSGFPSGFPQGPPGYPPGYQQGPPGYPPGYQQGPPGYPPGYQQGPPGYPPSYQQGPPGYPPSYQQAPGFPQGQGMPPGYGMPQSSYGAPQMYAPQGQGPRSRY